jgi:hypothetical protein
MVLRGLGGSAMKNFRYLRSVLAISAAALLGPLLGFVPASADVPATVKAQSAAVQEFGGCIASQGQGDVLILIDESGSLRDTDPEGQRISAARYLVTQLTNFASTNEIDLSIAVAGFDSEYHQRTGWENVSSGNSGPVLDALNDMRAEDDGLDTDYWAAFEGSRRALRDQAKKSDNPDPCQALVVFTDGKLDIEPRSGSTSPEDSKPYAPGVNLNSPSGAEEAEKRAQAALCRGGGLIDQLRRSNVKIFVVGLQAGASAADFDLVKKISEGGCGNVDREGMGQFTLAQNIGDLIFEFDALSNPNQPPLEETTPICNSKGCPAGTHVVVMDSSIRSARILAGSDLPTTTIEIRGPQGKQALEISSNQNGQRNLGDVSVKWDWISESVSEIQLRPNDPDSNDWVGVWQITFVDKSAPKDALARTNVHVEGDLALQVAEQEAIAWEIGTEVPVEFEIIRRGSGEAVDPSSLPSTLVISAAADLPGGQTQQLLSETTAKKSREPATVDLREINPGRGLITMDLQVTTAPAKGPDGRSYPGTALKPVASQLPIQVKTPPSYPTLETVVVDFGTTETMDPLTSAVAITGPGCIWLESADRETAPEGVNVSIESGHNSAKECLKLEEGKTSSLPLTLTPDALDNGSVTGNLMLRMLPAEGDGKALESRTPYLLDMRKPVDTGRLIGIFAALLAIGILIPLALLWIISWWRSRIPDSPLLVAAIPVESRGDQLVRTDSGASLTVAANELEPAQAPAGGSRDLLLPHGYQLRVSTLRNPLDPHVVLVGEKGQAASGASPSQKRGSARLPLAIHQNWVLVRTGANHFTVLLLFAGLADQSLRDQLVEDARRRGPDIADSLGGSTATAVEAVDSWGNTAAEDTFETGNGSNSDDDIWN